MLVLSRKPGERILIGDEIVVTVVRFNGGTVRLGIEAPRDFAVIREELGHAMEGRAMEGRAMEGHAMEGHAMEGHAMEGPVESGQNHDVPSTTKTNEKLSTENLIGQSEASETDSI